ncbi:MAG: hypothetical protein FWF33_02120 [Clostridiales bacterium]|nr:hypothetical protein [Clostridiales bacterium]
MNIEREDRRLIRRLSRETPIQNGARPEKTRKIGVVGACAGAGVTTVVFALAEYLAAQRRPAHARGRKLPEKPVGVLELRADAGSLAGCPYDKLGADRHFAGRNYVAFHRLAADGIPCGGLFNISGGVNWALRLPAAGQPDEPLPVSALLRLADAVPGDPLFCDIASSAGREVLAELLADMHQIVCIVDPLPSRLLASPERIGYIRAAEARGNPVVWVVNKMNAGVNRKELFRFLALKDPVFLPALPAETLYTTEYACRSVAAEPSFAPAFAEIIARLWGKL